MADRVRVTVIPCSPPFPTHTHQFCPRRESLSGWDLGAAVDRLGRLSVGWVWRAIGCLEAVGKYHGVGGMPFQ